MRVLALSTRPEPRTSGLDAPRANLEALLRRDRIIVIGALTAVCVVAWAYTLFGIGMVVVGPDMGATTATAWSPAYFTVMVGMWWLMMIAMMIPSATPTILLAAALNRRSARERPPYADTAAFVAGYLSIWFVFSVTATALQWALDQTELISSTMASIDDGLSGGLLIAAGVWQMTPIKQACLRHCRSPVMLLTGQADMGVPGALRIGATHGAYCLGCCWFLMALLFVGGVMNLFWIVGLALFVLIEKLAPAGTSFGRVAGVVLAAAGLVLWLF